MLAKLKALFGGRGGAAGGTDSAALDVAPTEYKGYRIRPAPYRAGSQFQTAGVIEKDFPDGAKSHRFVRAETHGSLDDAIEFAVVKAKQIIDQQGDRLFG